MNVYQTIIRAINPVTGELTNYLGPNITAICKADAIAYCQQNELGYCQVGDRIVSEIPCDNETWAADWKNRIDYDHDRN